MSSQGTKENCSLLKGWNFFELHRVEKYMDLCSYKKQARIYGYCRSSMCRRNSLSQLKGPPNYFDDIEDGRKQIRTLNEN